MALESHIAASEDALLEGLSFQGRSTASYLVSRQEATWVPSVSSPLRPQGTRLVRFNLADHSGWLIPSTLRLAFTIENLKEEGDLVPIVSSPACLFRRMRIIANGSAVIEDVDFFGRTTQLFSEFMSPQKRMIYNGTEWGSGNTASTLNLPATPDPILQDTSRAVIVQLMSNFLSQTKMIPLSMLPLTLECELDPDPDACFAAAGNLFELSRLRLLGSVVQLDQALQNSYAKHLLDGKTLPFYHPGMYSFIAAVPNGSSLYSLPIVRGFTRLSAVYVTFMDGAPTGTSKFNNRFFNPATNGGANTVENDDLEWYIQIGSERWPSFSCTSNQESYYRLQMCTAAHLGTTTLSISPWDFRNTKYVVAHSFEKAGGGGSHTGINTRSGSQATLSFRRLGAAITAHVVCVYDQITNLSMAGVEVLD